MNNFTAHKAFLSRIVSPSFFLFTRKVNNQYSIISLIFFLIRSKVHATLSSRILQGYPLGVGGNFWPRARAIQWRRRAVRDGCQPPLILRAHQTPRQRQDLAEILWQ